MIHRKSKLAKHACNNIVHKCHISLMVFLLILQISQLRAPVSSFTARYNLDVKFMQIEPLTLYPSDHIRDIIMYVLANRVTGLLKFALPLEFTSFILVIQIKIISSVYSRLTSTNIALLVLGVLLSCSAIAGVGVVYVVLKFKAITGTSLCEVQYK